MVTELASIINDDSSEIKTIEINEDSIIAPYAISNGETWFAFAEANSDGIEHLNLLELMQLALRIEWGEIRLWWLYYEVWF